MFDAELTPAGRKGWLAVQLGLAAWGLVLLGGLFIWAATAINDENLEPTVRTIGRLCLGVAAIPCVAGVIQGAAGVMLMPHDGPDLNRKWVYLGFALCFGPMLLVVVYFILWGR